MEKRDRDYRDAVAELMKQIEELEDRASTPTGAAIDALVGTTTAADISALVKRMNAMKPEDFGPTDRERAERMAGTIILLTGGILSYGVDSEAAHTAFIDHIVEQPRFLETFAEWATDDKAIERNPWCFDWKPPGLTD